MASSDVRWPVATFATEALALAACAAIDVSMRLPNARMERWTVPIALDDGTWAVQYPDAQTAARLGVTLGARRANDLPALRKVTAEERAERDAKPVEPAVRR